MEIFASDIKDKKMFNAEGDTLVQVKCISEEEHKYIYARYSGHSRALIGFEYVTGVKKKNPDGNVVYCYPCSEQFGRYGQFIAKKFADFDGIQNVPTRLEL